MDDLIILERVGSLSHYLRYQKRLRDEDHMDQSAEIF